ncbi:baseplate J/gp47 family protein [Desulfitobacterium chlororespirans]|uniref:Uncharacterized phage protein gp47/JayE n=1 Tax=Desulfitobacterium chlororespirans DSM 11544 TaxID=1121395 RepID=A0A1M7TQT8_9FIRM|nr:baseplate J/gp47 family protein [Desulfitobacterium chlororespirans]SHN73111.1 Uncharacterized phage protein gp47/JayE [Desulfitobacterium chlororespirans DSM 11544]
MEFKNYEQARNEMIAKASEASALTDWSPGTPNLSLVEAVATGLAGGYHTMQQLMEAHFITTAGLDYLKLYADELGAVWDAGAEASGEIICSRMSPAPFSETIPPGTVFRTPDGKVEIATTQEKVLAQGETQVTVPAQATMVGKLGMLQTGTELKLFGISVGLIEAITVAAPGFTGGRDPETAEQLRQRLLLMRRSPGTSGNKAQYLKWALSIPGVGGAYVEPLWDGRGTVKVYLIDTAKQPVSPAIAEEVQGFIDPLPHGSGSGVAPIGAVVTVVAAPEVTINVEAVVALTPGKNLGEVTEEFTVGMHNYFKAIAYSADPTVRIAKIGNILLDISGIMDYSQLSINGESGNITVLPGAVAVLGTVNLDE